MEQEKIAFRPVKGTESQIQQLANYNDGYLYFSTDTRKIYLDIDGWKTAGTHIPKCTAKEKSP